MEKIKKKYIINEKNRRVGVQLDIATFNKIEELLENYGLVQLIKETENDEKLDIRKAKAFYKNWISQIES
ncbi:MAG: hypothetical protein M1480_06075 [Bacteroidetes bacterium]|nr:hypothetical protein [Bacteroidota bacterium]